MTTSHALQRNRAERHRASVHEVDSDRHMHRKVDRHADNLRVIGNRGAGTRDAISRSEAVDLNPCRDNLPGNGISGCRACDELPANPLPGPRDALVADHL